MKKWLIFIFIICIPLISAKIIDIPEVFDVPVSGKSSDTTTGTTFYIYAGDRLIASKTNNDEIKYYYQDRIGNNRITASSSGGINEEFKALPFGQPIINEVRYGFTGKELDTSGLHYFGARYYNSNLGRFTSVDPIKSNHPYVYVSNNPLRYKDPTGENEEPVNVDTNIPMTIFTSIFAPDIVIHEGSHALAANLLGVEVEGFKPYHHINDGIPVFGSVYLNSEDYSEGGATSAMIDIAPYIVDIGVTSLLTSAINNDIIDPSSEIGGYYVTEHLGYSLLNPLINRGGDIENFVSNIGLPEETAYVVSAGLFYINYKLSSNLVETSKEKGGINVPIINIQF